MAIAEGCLRGGARLLQLRAKELGGAGLLSLADTLVALARRWDAEVIINDRPDIARLSGAAGVHVGQDDLTVDQARRVLGPQALIGISTHDENQVDAALGSSADYVAVGPIYETHTKATGYSARGLDLVRYASRRGRPIVGIGGITLERAPEVLAAGASSVAVVTALLGDPESRARAFLEL